MQEKIYFMPIGLYAKKHFIQGKPEYRVSHVKLNKANMRRVPVANKKTLKSSLEDTILHIEKDFESILEAQDVAHILDLSPEQAPKLLLAMSQLSFTDEEQVVCISRADFIDFLRENYVQIP